MKRFPILLLLCVLASCKVTSQSNKGKITGAYMGMSPTTTPRLLAPELLASSLDEYNGTFSPEGNIFVFTTNTPARGIISSMYLQKNNTWSAPEVASFSGTYSEYDPLFSPDGKRLYFSSERPVDDTSAGGRTNIWYVERKGSDWSEPQYVPLTGRGDYHSSLTQKGTIYFNVWENGNLFKATPGDTGYVTEELSPVVNSKNGEGDPFISPEEDYLIYRGYNNSLGRGDFYISFWIDGEWTEPENLGAPINSRHHEMCPNVTADGKYFIWASSRMAEKYTGSLAETRRKHQSYDNGQLNVYYISADFIGKMKARHLK